MLPLRNSSAWAGPMPGVSVSVCVCVYQTDDNQIHKYNYKCGHTHTFAHSHARQVIQISKANSEPGREPDPKPETEPSPRQQDCANILPATETKTYYYWMLPMCGWLCECERVCVCPNWIWFIEIWYFPWYEHCKSSKHEPGTETRRVWQTQEQSTLPKGRTAERERAWPRKL